MILECRYDVYCDLLLLLFFLRISILHFEIEHWLSLHSIVHCSDPSVPCYKTQKPLICKALNSPSAWNESTRPLRMFVRISGNFRWAQIFRVSFRVDCWESGYVGRIRLAAVRLSACQVIEKLWNPASPEDIKSVAHEIQPLITVFLSSYTSWTCQSNNVSGFNIDGSGLSASHYGPPVKMTLHLWMC